MIHPNAVQTEIEQEPEERTETRLHTVQHSAGSPHHHNVNSSRAITDAENTMEQRSAKDADGTDRKGLLVSRDYSIRQRKLGGACLGWLRRDGKVSCYLSIGGARVRLREAHCLGVPPREANAAKTVGSLTSRDDTRGNGANDATGLDGSAGAPFVCSRTWLS